MRRGQGSPRRIARRAEAKPSLFVSSACHVSFACAFCRCFFADALRIKPLHRLCRQERRSPAMHILLPYITTISLPPQGGNFFDAKLPFAFHPIQASYLNQATHHFNIEHCVFSSTQTASFQHLAQYSLPARTITSPFQCSKSMFLYIFHTSSILLT